MVENYKMVDRIIQEGGRITLPIDWRKEMGLSIGSKVRMLKMDTEIKIKPPTSLTELRGIIKTDKPSKKPKQVARRYMMKKLRKELKK